MSDKYIKGSQFGSIPPKAIVAFATLFILYIVGTSIIYMIAEKWNFLDALYFAIVTLSTVGYGDIVVTSGFGQIVNIIFTLVSFCGVFLFARVLVGYLVDHQIAAIITRIKTRRDRGVGLSGNVDVAQTEMREEQDSALQKGKNLRWLIHLVVFITWLFVWTLFYGLYDEEDMNIFQAMYFGIVTATTIGYGKHYPRTDAGKWLCILLTMFGTIALATLAGSISQGVLALINGCFRRQKGTETERYAIALDRVLEHPRSGKGEIGRWEFVCKMLIATGKLQKKQVNALQIKFDELDKNDDGVLNEQDFAKIIKTATITEQNDEYQSSHQIEMASRSDNNDNY